MYLHSSESYFPSSPSSLEPIHSADHGVEAETAPNKSTAAKLAGKAISLAMNEYLEASAYFRSIGAQTPSVEYGGSRSLTYKQMLDSAVTARELFAIRRDYKSRHEANESNHDEYGGFLRIAGYRLRNVPVVGRKLEEKVREDDKLMANAKFTYPEHTVRYSAPVEALDQLEM